MMLLLAPLRGSCVCKFPPDPNGHVAVPDGTTRIFSRDFYQCGAGVLAAVAASNILFKSTTPAVFTLLSLRESSLIEPVDIPLTPTRK
jgi:hypothetical protein